MNTTTTQTAVHATRFKHLRLGALTIFYREAGPPDAPVLLLLHGFPASSHMFRHLMEPLADKYRVIAPDYPGFGLSSCPSPQEFEYTFDHLADVLERFVDALGLARYSLYVQDYGGPVGFRLASQRPERVGALLIQNANAYSEGLSPAVQEMWRLEAAGGAAAMQPIVDHMLTLEGIRENYIHHPGMVESVSPEAYLLDHYFMERPGVREIQAALLGNYKTNFPQYAGWQAYFRGHQPPALVLWGKHDPVFIVPGAEAYLRDLPQAELHVLDGGHFLLEGQHRAVAVLIDQFLAQHLTR
jgi:pimeloyl-ACP methyl ester carboxylesterase